MAINQTQVRLSEECLYAAKNLARRIGDLEAYMESVVPPSPGSVLKMVGRPVAKTPFDTSITERWAIRRVCCDEAVELEVKVWLYRELCEFRRKLTPVESEFVKLCYDHEMPPKSVTRRMGVNDRQYYRIRQRVIERFWDQIRGRERLLETAVN